MTAIAATNRISAEIIAFPPRGRFAPGERRVDAVSAGARVAEAVCGSAWYHEEAVREERSRDN